MSYVSIDNNLSFSEHINIKVNKANAIMGVIRRSFRHLDTKTFTTLFKSMVRPHIEYAASVWNHHLKSDITKVESVQRRATKQVPHLKNLSYKERLTKLKLPTMLYCRMRGDMIEVYKILTGKYDPLVTSDLLPLHREHVPDSRTRGHSLKLLKRRFRRKLSKYSFSRRVVGMWNSLPDDTISAQTVDTFENRLDDHWSKLEVKYDFDLAMSRANPDAATGGIFMDLCKAS